MSKIKISLTLLSFLLIAQPRTEAQLNGDFFLNICEVFKTRPYCFQDSNRGDSLGQYAFNFLLGETTNLSFQNYTIRHNPKTGVFSISAKPQFEDQYGPVYPSDLNPSLTDESWDISEEKSDVKITGKTYTNKKTNKPLLDISSGTITLAGVYTLKDGTESQISKGSLAFRASNLDCDSLYADGVPIKITGSVSLKNKSTKKFNIPSAPIRGLFWGGDFYFEDNGVRKTEDGFFMDLNLTTSGGIVTGTAKAYYSYYQFYYDIEPEPFQFTYPDPKKPSTEFLYSVKGTSKNGIATLNLTGQGVIKGLKATIYIDESTEEIVQNGKNSITLYGQTITY